jgi:hypothetical protein
MANAVAPTANLRRNDLPDPAQDLVAQSTATASWRSPLASNFKYRAGY